jgi:hypothetical protein
LTYAQGINFRNTGPYVTDGANTTHDLAVTIDYPWTTPQGNVVGWEQLTGGTSVPSTLDRNNAVDARLAGLQDCGGFPSSSFLAHSGSNSSLWRMDLPAAGSYDIRTAHGDPNGALMHEAWIDFFDGTTLLANVINNQAMSSGGHFWDATGAERTSVADWVANNAVKTLVFATTILRVRFTNNSQQWFFNHIFVQASAAPATVSRRVLSPTGARTGSRQMQQ